MTTRHRLWLALLIVILGGTFGIALPILAWRRSLTSDDFLAVAKLLLSWPVVVAGVGLYFLARFQPAIDTLLRHVGSMRLPGGVDIQIQQPDAARSATTPASGSLSLSPDQQAELERFIEDLSARAQLTEAAKQDLERQYHEALVESIGWKWRYLNLFLAPITKQVLRWFADNSGRPVQRNQFHSLWVPAINDSSQRETILDVLVENQLVDARGLNLSLSTEGYRYLVWAGMIPPPPPALATS